MKSDLIKINLGGLFVKIEKYFEKQTKILKLLPHEFSFEYFLNKKRILLKIYMMAKNTIKKKEEKDFPMETGKINFQYK
jgi:hypothetical protein